MKGATNDKKVGAQSSLLWWGMSAMVIMELTVEGARLMRLGGERGRALSVRDK